MNEKTDRDAQPSSTNTTHIGSVTGQVHTGSGNIIVKSFSAGMVSSKEDFLEALRTFKTELEAARQQGLPEETIDDAVTEVEAAEREVRKEAPQSGRIIKRLEQAKSIIVTGTGVVTAANEAASVAHNLVQLIQNGIHAVGTIFQ